VGRGEVLNLTGEAAPPLQPVGGWGAHTQMQTTQALHIAEYPAHGLSYCGRVQVQLCPSFPCTFTATLAGAAGSPRAVMPATANYTGGLGTCIGCASCPCCMLQVCRLEHVQHVSRAGAADALGLSSYDNVLHVCNAPRHAANCMQCVPLAPLQYRYS
jgi:hypothetical protein